MNLPFSLLNLLLSLSRPPPLSFLHTSPQTLQSDSLAEPADRHTHGRPLARVEVLRPPRSGGQRRRAGERGRTRAAAPVSALASPSICAPASLPPFSLSATTSLPSPLSATTWFPLPLSASTSFPPPLSATSLPLLFSVVTSLSASAPASASGPSLTLRIVFLSGRPQILGLNLRVCKGIAVGVDLAFYRNRMQLLAHMD